MRPMNSPLNWALNVADVLLHIAVYGPPTVLGTLLRARRRRRL
jgi:hypothetical protein